MRTVWKYVLPVVPGQEPRVSVLMPIACRFLSHAEVADDAIEVWAEVDLTTPMVPVVLDLVMTGAPVPEHARHVATLKKGWAVGHVYATWTESGPMDPQW